MINTTIQSFTIQKKLGAGGMATVYLAENSIGKKAAIKVLHTKYFHDAHVKQRFVQEAKVMAQLHHPNICSVISLEETEDFAAIIMEHLKGQDMSEYISQNGAIEEAKALDWLQQIVPALDYAHSCGMVHRDIKPSNFFVTTSGQIKVMDFGIAKAQDSLISTHTNSRMGSVAYMSPEQIKSPKYVTHKTDIYSLGVTLHHLLAGKIPYDTTTQSEYTVMEKIIKEPLPVLSCSDQLNQLIQVATQKDPKKRPESLANWLALKDESNYKAPRKTPLPPDNKRTILRQPQGPVKGKTPPAQRKTQPTPKPRRNKWLIPLASGFAIILLSVGYFMFKPDSKPEILETFEENGLYGYKLSDSIVIPAQYTSAKPFTMGKALVSTADSSYYISPKGKWVAGQELDQSTINTITEAEKQTQALKNEDDLWQTTKVSNTKNAYDSYLKQYPQGQYKSEAIAAIKTLEQQEYVIQQRQKELNYWNKALKENTLLSYQKYLNTYPNGAYESQALNKMKNIEEDDWRMTLNNPSVNSYSTFINKYPNSKLLSMAYLELGSQYQRGYNNDKDMTKAIIYYKKAAELRNTRAMRQLATLADIDENYQSAEKWYLKILSTNDPYESTQVDENRIANGALGVLYSNPENGLYDIPKAIKHFNDALGEKEVCGLYPPNCYHLGVIYEKGKGIKQNIGKAIYYYEKQNAWEGGDRHSYERLGYIYEKGLGHIKKSNEKAKSFYLKAGTKFARERLKYL